MSQFDSFLNSLAAETRFREIPPHRTKDKFLDLCSNDYMGLSAMTPLLRRELDERFPEISFSASASRLLALEQNIHLQLEEFLKSLYDRPALLFNSGYHANTGITAALNLPGTLFVCDKLIHASMIDGLRAGRCDMKRFKHNDMSALNKIIANEVGNYQHIVIMVESIYSMDGDMAPLEELIKLKREFPKITLYVDEAHGFGVRGEKGLGLVEELGVIDQIDIIVGTLGKAACSYGAFAICSPKLKSFFINTARSFIFSTALPPINIAWSILTIEKLVSMKSQRDHLKDISLYFRNKLRELGFDIPYDDTPIVPLLTGTAENALIISRHLQEAGILALPIRRPTVPAGGERIRFSLNANLSRNDIDRVTDNL